MNFYNRITLIVLVLLLLSALSCDKEQSGETGFAIILIESGELILTDEHISEYIWDEHRIRLRPKGIERWESFVEFDRSQDPPVRKLGGLTNKEFVVTLNEDEMYRGHFSSMASSLMNPGVLIYDTMGLPQGEVWMRFVALDEAPKDDPRGHPEIKAHFRRQGKLRDTR